MLPKYHIILGAIFSIILYFLFPAIGLIGAIIIFLSSFLIDVDHYLYYVYKKKDWNLRRSSIWFLRNRKLFNQMSRAEKEKIYMGLCFLHGFEAILILLIIWAIFYPNNLALFIIIGFVFHQILDAIHLYSVKYNYDKVISFFYSLKNSKNKKLLQDIK